MTRKQAVNRADTAFSRYIRARDNWTCFTCHKRGEDKDGVMQCGHLITRAKYSTRWDERNAVCQCSGCNLRHEYQPEILTDAYISHHGVDVYHQLVYASNQPRKLITDEILDIASHYSALYKSITGV
jgi:hypothetical protein